MIIGLMSYLSYMVHFDFMAHINFILAFGSLLLSGTSHIRLAYGQISIYCKWWLPIR